MRFAKIIKDSVVDGAGFRVSLFVQGCPHHCKGCFNPETWAFGGGKPFTSKETAIILSELSKPYVKGLTLVGGEPLGSKENCEGLLKLIKEVKKFMREDQDIWLWTGYHFEDLDELQMSVVNECSVVISEPFILKLKNRHLRWAGSMNQRAWKNINGQWKQIDMDLL